MASPDELSATKPSGIFYTCQNDLRSSHFLFPKVGEESAKAFHLYLQNWGMKLPTLHEGYEQLLNLQALFWRKVTGIDEMDYQSSKPPNANQTYRWTDDQDSAEHRDYVLHALEGRGSGKVYQTRGDHVFIIRDDSKKGCDNLSCPEVGEDTLERIKRGPLSITLEPLLDWGTITPASDMYVASGKIIAFRRNGPRMNDPLWTQQVKKLVPKQTRTYCLDCLQELVNRRAEAQSTTNRSAGQSQQGRYHHVPTRPIQRPTSRSELYDMREAGGSDDASSCEGLVPSTAGSLQLDGVTEQTPYTESRNYAPVKMNDRESSWAVEHKTSFVKHTMSGKGLSRSQRLPGTYSPPVAHSRVDSVHSHSSTDSSSYYTLPCHNSQLLTPGSSGNSAFVYRDPTSVQQNEYEKLGSAILLENSVPDFGSGHREFGRDVETNLVCHFFTNHRVRRENMTKTEDTNICNIFTVVNPRGPLTLKRSVKTNNIDYEELNLSDDASDAAKEDADPDTPDGEYTPIKNKGKARSKFVSPSKKRKRPSPPSKPTVKAQQSHAPVYRKHDPTTDDSPPFGVTQAAFETYNKHLPIKSDLICTCHKPARTNDVPITQCVNKGCKVRWYHKDCLSTRGKLQARHGTYLCEQCQNEKYYAELSRTNGWSGKRLVQNEVAMPFTGHKMAGILGNTGNFQAVANPYGLAMSATSNALSPSAQPFIPGITAATDAAVSSRLAVGSEPSLGLETSRPYFVTEAYTRAGEHQHVADEAWENAQMCGRYSDE